LKSSIQSVEATYFLHATENPLRVSGAVAKLISPDSEPELEEMEGHFGNKIVRARFHLAGKEAERAFKAVLGAMTPRSKEELTKEFGKLIDEHSALFLRLDKQALIKGSVALGSSDAVRVKVKPRAFLVHGDAAEFFSSFIEGRQ
jgi:RNA binding exosome subunit